MKGVKYRLEYKIKKYRSRKHRFKWSVLNIG